MTRKDYRRIASEMADDNPRFNWEHFLVVVEGEKEIGSRPPRQAV